MTLRFREVEEIVQGVGLEVISMERNTHIKTRVRSKDGRETVQIFPCTPSDRRGMLNLKSALKRFARGGVQ